MSKKKIKDLTIAELNDICSSHSCPTCPLYGSGGFCLIAQATFEYWEDQHEEREVEVDE